MDFDSLAVADRQELVRLADLLEVGILSPPLNALSLRSHLGEAPAEAVAQCFSEIPQLELAPSHIALLLRAFAAGQQAGLASAPPIEVVVSGPDVAGSARDTGVVMRQLFSRARDRVLAVGFAIHQGKSVFKALADRLDDDESLEAILCIDVRRDHGDNASSGTIVRDFAEGFVRNEWPGRRLPRAYYDPRSLKPTGRTASSMHAKCVVIDGREAFVTSANFTEAAQERNIELGLLAASCSVASRIERHFDSLIQREQLIRLPLVDA